MKVKLENLQQGTVFKFKGVTYKIGLVYWSCGQARKEKRLIWDESESSDNVGCSEAIPKYGGQFQERLSNFLSWNAEVEVEP